MHARQTYTVEANLQWEFYQDPESRRWIAICAHLGVTIEAESAAELRECIEEGTDLLFRNLLKDNELDSFLKARGWKVVNSHPAANDDDMTFDVPYELVRRNGHGPAQRAH